MGTTPMGLVSSMGLASAMRSGLHFAAGSPGFTVSTAFVVSTMPTPPVAFTVDSMEAIIADGPCFYAGRPLRGA